MDSPQLDPPERPWCHSAPLEGGCYCPECRTLEPEEE